MKKYRLDQGLLAKLKDKTGYSEKYIREQLSKKANVHGISSEAYLVIWAKRLGLGTSIYQSKLAPHIQTEVRDILPTAFNPAQSRPKIQASSAKAQQSNGKSPISLAIEYLIQDTELKNRCSDLIKARANYDRVFREATTVLEDRIKKLSGVKGLRPADLVGKALSPNPTKAILKVSNEIFEQEGFFSICKGLMLSFRDTTHHELSDKFLREDALKFCGFVDSLLGILNKAEKQEVI